MQIKSRPKMLIQVMNLIKSSKSARIAQNMVKYAIYFIANYACYETLLNDFDVQFSQAGDTANQGIARDDCCHALRRSGVNQVAGHQFPGD